MDFYLDTREWQNGNHPNMLFGFPQVLHHFDSFHWESQQKPHESSKKEQNPAIYYPRCSMYGIYLPTFTIIYPKKLSKCR